MKKSHDHTQLKRLAAISLCLVMCLSVVPFMAPSASAADAEVPATPKGRGTVCITFDDISSSVYDYAYPVMAEAGITGTVFVTTSTIGRDHPRSDQTRYMNVAELLDLQDNGWEIGSHSVNHTNYRTAGLTDEQIRYEMGESKRILTEMGFDIDTFAYPFGGYTANSSSIGADYYSRMRITAPSFQFMTDYPASRLETGVYYDTVIPTWAQCKALIDRAIETDSTVTLLFHWLDSDGNILGTEYDIHTLVDYIVDNRVNTVNYRDLPNAAPDADIYVWDGEGGDGLASTAANWRKVTATGDITNDVLPTSGSHLLWTSDDVACTYDIDIVPYSWTIGRGYDANILIPTGSTVAIGPGGVASITGTYIDGGAGSSMICAGDWNTRVKTGTIDLTMTSNCATLQWNNIFVFGTLTIDSGAYVSVICQVASPIYTNSLLVEDDAILNIPRDSAICVAMSDIDSTIRLDGAIRGMGLFDVATAYDRDLDLSGVSVGDMVVRPSKSATSPPTVILRGGDDILADHLTLMDPEAKMMTVTAVGALYVGAISITDTVTLRGDDATIYTAAWDTSAGKWAAGNGTVVLLDGGHATLALAQSFNALYIASDDGRTASWSMTAIGAQAPTVYGLRPGSVHTWYMDGVEQGEVTADANGTIALSYMSTGLHTLEVKPTPMTEAMDGMAAAIGIIVALAVLGGVLGMLGKAFGRLKF